VGGSILYDKNCYNCHSNDKRGHSPMNVSFNSSQTSAVINPGTAPLSSSPSTTPDPNYQTPTIVAVNGAELYAASCESCHGLLATSTKLNRSFSVIKAAIVNNSGGMASLGALSDLQLQAIANALVK
jgi:mono/diheme cytochrome c family protein